MGFLVTTSGLKRALGRVVGQITDALTALHQSLSGDIAAAEQQSNAAISAEATARQQGDAAEAAARASAVTDIWDLIPSNASAANSLATQLFVNSSIENMSANRVRYNMANQDFPTKASLDAAIASGTFYYQGELYTPKKNDYCGVLADEDYGGAATRYVYDGEFWGIQSVVNNTGFTQAQMGAINSGVTAYGWAALQNTVSGKQAAITMPASGKLAGMTPAQAFQYLSDWLNRTQQSDVGIKVTDIDVV